MPLNTCGIKHTRSSGVGWGISPLVLRRYRWLFWLGRGPQTPVGEALGFVTLPNGYEELNTLPSPLWGKGSEQKSCDDWPCWNGFFGALCWMLAQGGRVRFGSGNPCLFK